MVLGDLGQGVAALDRVELGLRTGFLDLELGFDFADARRVARRDDRLFSLGLVLGGALHDDFAVLFLNLEVFHPCLLALDAVHDAFRHVAKGLAQGLTGIFHEFEQHGLAPFSAIDGVERRRMGP